MIRKILKIISMILAILLLTLIISTIVNQILLKVEKNRYSIYGQYVQVDNKEMYVSLLGEGKNTIVILPGSGCAGSTVLYRPLAKKLAQNNRVIIVEYFGYGFSDDTYKDRTTQNIVEETRKALKQVCSEESYILMPHSMSGVYSLYWAMQYPEEVKAIVGLDMTVAQMENENNINWTMFEEEAGLTKEEYYNQSYPLILNPLIKETGMMRWANNLYNKSYYEILESYNLYSEKELKILKKEFNHYPSMAILKEYENNMINDNIRELQNTNLPINLPVLHFRATKPLEVEKEYLGRDTISLINKTITNSNIQKIEIVEGSHEVIYLDAINEIVEKTNEFIELTKKWGK